MAKQKEPTRPVFEQKFNHIRLVIWENQTKGQIWFNIVITRRFRDGEEWKESSSFSGLGDLALVSSAVRSAEEFLRGKSLTHGQEIETSSEIEGL
ncbi:hypothetical protein SH449x_000158 [Pirellulaceae bacterium SH449]